MQAWNGRSPHPTPAARHSSASASASRRAVAQHHATSQHSKPTHHQSGTLRHCLAVAIRQQQPFLLLRPKLTGGEAGVELRV